MLSKHERNSGPYLYYPMRLANLPVNYNDRRMNTTQTNSYTLIATIHKQARSGEDHIRFIS